MSRYANTLIICLFFAFFVQASHGFELDNDEEAALINEPRIFTDIGNATSTFSPTSILAAILVGILVALAFGPALTNNNRSAYDRNYYNQQEQDNFAYVKTDRRSLDDVAHQLYALAEAFKKYEVEESCQKYVACAARRNTESYALMNIVDDVMKAMLKSGHEKIRAKDAYVGELMDAYLQGERTSCQQHKSICYRKKFN
eukprot:TRINITY_DN1613_c0_g1_i2.p1 TRINITY_DN1613_c0_g1~~TRINITY_DN1613_c0_g1_i2.p1  ORF type:complete len:200 (+),score=53.91 TRINITY_DN1613_c0_g1_i2:173-772(+)